MAVRFSGGLACFYVAFDLALKAAGREPQVTFTDHWIWVWWVLAGFWVIEGFALWASE